MQRPAGKTKKIQLWSTESQKNKIQRFANLDNKTLSEYILTAALSPKIDKSQAELLVTLNQNLQDISKNQKVLIQLLLTIGTEKLPISKEQMITFYNEMIATGGE